MSHALHLSSTTYDVWLARQRGHYALSVDGSRSTVSLVPRGPVLNDLVVDGVAGPACIAVRGNEIHVHLDGEAHVVRHIDSLERFTDSGADAAGLVARAPMPGSVIAVHVVAGQAVTKGEPLVVIESMKMETVISAAQDGVVDSVHVTLGQNFDRDAALVTLERKDSAA